MKRIYIFWLLISYALQANAQTISVSDQQTQEPLAGVVLISESPKASTITNVRGKADISKFDGSERIQVRHLSYETRVLSYDFIEAAGFDISLEQKAMNLDQVVVSGTRWKQTSGNVPSKIISVLPQEMALQNPQTAADLIGASGKVYIQKSQQGGGSPMIRGFATSRLIYTIDGVRMNTAIFRGGNLQNVINLDPFAIERTEVLFGPGSVIYGSDAIGGAMSFQTLSPQLSLNEEPLVTGKAITRYSSANNEKTGHFDVNVGWKKWSMLTSFSTWDYGHLRQGSKGPEDYIKDYYPERHDSLDVLITQDDKLLQIPSAYSQVNLMQKFRFRPNDKWDFQYGFHYSATSPYGRYDRHKRVRNGTARYAEWNYGPQKWMMNNVTVNHQNENTFYDQVTLRLAQQAFEESRISRDLNSDIRERRTENVTAWSANLDFTKSTGRNNTLFYGAEYIQNDVHSDGRNDIIFNNVIKPDSVVDGPDRYPQSAWRSIALYLNNEYRISEELTLQAGLRYNQFLLDADFSDNADYYPLPFTTAEINNGALTGSIGGVYKPTGSLVVKANFGTAFRSPNVDDIGKVFDSEPGSVVVPNPDLQAEYAYNLDLGVAKVFDDYLKVDLTGYYTILQNAMVRRDYELNGRDSIMYDGTLSRVQAMQNAAVANVYGVQAGMELKLPAGFTFLSDLNFQVGEEELDDGSTSPSRHAAPLFGESRLRYQKKGFTLEINSVYQGEKTHDELPVGEREKYEIYALDENGNSYAPAWYTLNVKALYQLTEMISISGGVENLSDQRYRPYSSGISGAGRNVLFALRAEF